MTIKGRPMIHTSIPITTIHTLINSLGIHTHTIAVIGGSNNRARRGNPNIQ